MGTPWQFTPFAKDVPADVALRIAGLFADRAESKDDMVLVKAMLVQLAQLGIERAEIRRYPALERMLVEFSGGP